MRRSNLPESESRTRRVTWAFAKDRLDDSSVLNWALGLSEDKWTERDALRDLFDHNSTTVREPYNLAWRCIFEYWAHAQAATSYDRFQMKRALKLTGPQPETVQLIVNAIAPRLKVERGDVLAAMRGEKLPKKARTLRQIFSVSIDSEEQIDPSDINLDEIVDRNFLILLANNLNSSLILGLNFASLIGSIDDRFDVTNWQVHRVYFVPEEQFVVGGGEPDRNSKGFAPTTKLMFAVTERLATVDLDAARRFVYSWDARGWKLYRRLWAAAARRSDLVSGADVAAFLEEIKDAEFWQPGQYPEIAEVRALRWNTLPADFALRIEKRLLKGIPTRLIPKRIEESEIQRFKEFHSFVEFKRIIAGGGILSKRASAWMERVAPSFPELPPISLTYRFNHGIRMLSRPLSSTHSFDSVPAHQLLEEIASALSDSPGSDRSRDASDFIADNASLVITLLGKSTDHAIRGTIWRSLGYSFRPSDLNASISEASVDDKARVSVALVICGGIAIEEPEILKDAIEGLASFMSNWDKLLNGREEFLASWLVLWPVAVSCVNSGSKTQSSLRDRSCGSAVGQLAIAFTSASRKLENVDETVSTVLLKGAFTHIRETVGEAKLQAQYILLRNLAYFYEIAHNWTEEVLMQPLRDMDEGKIDQYDLWEAFVAGPMPQKEIVAVLADSVVAAAISEGLSADVKGALAARVIWSTILDRCDGQRDVVPAKLTQQMLRIGEDRVRTEALGALKDFLKQNREISSLERFMIVKSIFDDVWPKELTLRSRALSDALADFPAAAGSQYVDATNLILPYLIPFDCWSLWEYGVLEHEGNNFKIIDDAAKAKAFLTVLDKTIGSEDGAVIPHGLEDALRHIVQLSPSSEKDISYQRLLTLSRR